jgi:hypothetical protein
VRTIFAKPAKTLAEAARRRLKRRIIFVQTECLQQIRDIRIFREISTNTHSIRYASRHWTALFEPLVACTRNNLTALVLNIPRLTTVQVRRAQSVLQSSAAYGVHIASTQIRLLRAQVSRTCSFRTLGDGF